MKDLPVEYVEGELPMTELNWSEWCRFSEFKSNPCEGLREGVYQVRAVLANGNPVLIHRACGVDTMGLLYIGCGGLNGRVGYLMNIWVDDPKRHHNFTQTFIDYLRLDRIADRRLLEVRWAETDNSRRVESELIDSYAQAFGDLPPGNLTPGVSHD